MRRWNGWGDESTNMELPNSADTFLQEKLGNGHRLTDCQLSDVISKVPNSKLISHPLISIDKEQLMQEALDI